MQNPPALEKNVVSRRDAKKERAKLETAARLVTGAKLRKLMSWINAKEVD